MERLLKLVNTQSGGFIKSLLCLFCEPELLINAPFSMIGRRVVRIEEQCLLIGEQSVLSRIFYNKKMPTNLFITLFFTKRKRLV